MKTILEWLNEAKEQGYEWADAAIRNYDPKFSNLSYNSLYEALAGAFIWRASPEGHTYWEGVSESLRATDAGYRVLSPTTAVNSTSLESLIEDLGKLNNALRNLEYNDTLKEPYRTQIYDATKASYEEQFAEVKSEIAKKLGIEPIKERKLIGWIATDKEGKVCLYGCIMKWARIWGRSMDEITPEKAIALCGRVPKWEDNEPTPIYQ